MLKIYFDTNIFSEIAKGKKFSWLEEVLFRADKDLLFLFSQAHLNDLNNDKTDNKFSELSIINQIAKNNFLHEDGKRNTIVNSLLFPEEAFNFYGDIQENVGSFLNQSLGPTGFPELDNYLELLKKQKIDLGPHIEQILSSGDPETKKLYKELGIGKRHYDISEWTNVVANMIDKFENDNSLIKMIRRLSKQELEVDKLNIKIDDIKFDHNLSSSKIGKNFQELLDQHMELLPGQSDTLFNRITTGFNLINFLGFDYERNKKVKFRNTQNDGQHCYYAGVGDLLVSNDIGLLNKSKFLYNYYKIETSIMDLEEFENFLKTYNTKSFSNESQLAFNLIHDKSKSLIIAEKRPIISHNQYEQIRKLNKRYWGYFNRLSEVGSIESDEQYVILYKNDRRTGNITFIKEVNHIIDRLNLALDGSASHLEKEDLEEINNEDGRWNGRTWETDDYIYWLRFNPETKRLGLQIGVFT